MNTKPTHEGISKTYWCGLGLSVLLGLGGCAGGSGTAAIEAPETTAAIKAKTEAVMAVSEANPLRKEKLQIVFCFGQSNMVGLADVKTTWYLTQPQYIPPREMAVKKSRFFNWNFYWSGVRYCEGPRRADLKALLAERTASRWKWRQRLWGRNGIKWDEAAWGKHPGGGRGNVYPFLDRKAEEEGIYKRIAEILDSGENRLNVDAAYDEMIKRDSEITEQLERVRSIYLKGTTAEAFDTFDAAVKAAISEKALITSVGKGKEFTEAAKHRAFHAELARKHLGLPVAKRTYIKVHGHTTGPITPNGSGNQRNAEGRLTVGYGGKITRIGPEYGVGITLERLVDAPILLVKCSWGNTALAGAWRPPSLDGAETPTERARREAANIRMAAEAKAAGREFTPRPAPSPTGKLTYCWGMTMPEIDKVLADPGKYHPEYDPNVGYEIAGLVWFQGYSDKDNPAYGELLAAMIKDLREKVNAPDMPVVCGTLGMAAFKQAAFSNGANAGMLQASQMPELAGTVDVVNTAPFYPLEFNILGQILKSAEKGSPEYEKASRVRSRAISEKGFHYHGSAKCFLLMGDAMGRSLANLMAGGKPLILQELGK